MTERRYTTTIDGRSAVVSVQRGEHGTWSVRFENGETVDVQVLAEGGTLAVLAGERTLELAPWGDGFGTPGGVRIEVETRRKGARAHAAGAGSGTVQAPMPGRIVKVLVTEGDEVRPGAGLVVMEAMKMENEIGAPHAGKVTRVLVRAGDAVERDAALVELG